MDTNKKIHKAISDAAKEFLQFKVVDPKSPTTLYIGGGAACYGWLMGNCRTSKDIDIDMSGLHRHFEIPQNVTLPQKEDLWHIDNKYTTSLSVMHEDYDKRALPLATSGNITISLLSPVDLAISKLDRFSERDKGDILSLLSAKVLDRFEFEKTARDAIEYGVGLKTRLVGSLLMVLKEYDALLDKKRNTSQPSRKKR